MWYVVGQIMRFMKANSVRSSKGYSHVRPYSQIRLYPCQTPVEELWRREGLYECTVAQSEQAASSYGRSILRVAFLLGSRRRMGHV